MCFTLRIAKIHNSFRCPDWSDDVIKTALSQTRVENFVELSPWAGVVLSSKTLSFRFKPKGNMLKESNKKLMSDFIKYLPPTQAIAIVQDSLAGNYL